ncbi:putative GPI-anchored protein At1g61900 [Bidens hawaiensis]|uniref:putative GPI-anchored protein At1g61900 n=1 Tax=Bidens hawaiensis TaxID=980011 RepID=UPI00404A837C
MRQKQAQNLTFLFLLILCFNDNHCNSLKNPILFDTKVDTLMPKIAPTANPQPLYPLLAPSPLSPFTITNNSAPKLSGMCTLDFDAIDTMMSMTAIDCFTVFAPYLANVVCCPQFEVTLVILIGQSSKKTKYLSLNSTLAKHCLSDFDQILISQGANNSLQQICSIGPSNLTEASCPVKDVVGFEKMVNTSKILANCGKIDLVNECCQETCQNALMEAAKDLASVSSLEFDTMGIQHPSDISNRVISDCKNIVLRWLASKLEPARAKEVLRGLASCNLNKVCPLVLPNVGPVARGCGDEISNKTSCCTAVGGYVSHLQKQSFLTNFQALNCAASLGKKLQNENITNDIYKLCRISLQDFSLQANGMQESGCLLPSLPSDATFDRYSGVSFLCDLNDHIPATWPSLSHLPPSSCNKTIKIPALPAAASGQKGLYNYDAMILLLYVMAFVLAAIY